MKKILLLTIFLSSYSWSSAYAVCNNPSLKVVTECVRGYMAVGYIPQGGISVIYIDTEGLISSPYRYYQAVYQK